MQTYDIMVIGAGPGGYVAAIRAAQLGLKACVVEKQHLGGVCLNWGCIPTKALLRSTEIFHHLNHADQFGLSAKDISFDLKKIVARSRTVAEQLSGGIAHLLKKNKVDVILGTAKLQGLQGGARQVQVTDAGGKASQVAAKHVILATGARARQLPGLEADGDYIWTAKEAMTPQEMPKKLLIVGSGAIGIEFASFYRTLGAAVTVLELQARILPNEDEEISALAQKSFEKQGMTFLLGSSVTKVDKVKKQVTLKTPTGEKVESFDQIISAVGIVGNTEGLGLEGTKVKLDRGHIVTKDFNLTDEPGIYAIGDVTAGPWLAHKASHEAILCVEAIAGQKPKHGLKKSNIPGCTYSHPQVASVGMTQVQAEAAGHKVRVGRFPFMANGKAIAMGESEGLVKTIFDAKTGELLGAHMIGAEVTELIQGFCIAKTMEATEEDLMHTIFAHPTLSEMMHESVLDAYGRAIHF
jgi:dihydrolipoamide dehydrogenase